MSKDTSITEALLDQRLVNDQQSEYLMSLSH